MSQFSTLELRALEFLNLTLEAEIGIEVDLKISPHYAKSIFFKMRKTNPNFSNIGIELSRDRPNAAIWLYKTQESEK